MYKKLIENDLINYGFLRNQWLWFHMLGAGILSIGFKYLSIFLLTYFNIPIIYHLPILIVLIPYQVLCIAYLWEVVEDKLETKGQDKIRAKIYGSVNAYWHDTTGDLLGAHLISILIVLA